MILRPFFLSILWLIASPLFAADYSQYRYHAEIIIFAQQTNQATLQEEYWPPEVTLPDLSGSTRLTAQQTKPINLLAPVLRRLQNTRRYRVIHSTAWSLPPRRSSIHIQAGQRYTTADRPQHLPALEPYEIDGRMTIAPGRYFDITADLLFSSTVLLPASNGTLTDTFRQFRLTQSRRIKAKTIHYFDHPLFGVIIGINRYQLGTPATSTKTNH